MRSWFWITACASLLALTAPVSAQTSSAQPKSAQPAWPSKPVRLIVPFAAGATPDIVGRLIAEDIQSRHPGSSIIVETDRRRWKHRHGCRRQGHAGWHHDRHFAGRTAGHHTMLFSELPYDPQKNIAPVQC